MSTPTRTQLLEDQRLELASYVKCQERRGKPITFQQALLAHRTQVIENARDDGDGLWRERLVLLDQLCVEEGVV